MNASLAKWCMLTDELMKNGLVLSQRVEKSTIGAETVLVVTLTICAQSLAGFTREYIDEGERSDEMDPSRTDC